MPKRTDIHSVLIIGAGPIIIGQACEFDYSGTQACKALREEGYRVVLVNSNPATIMTDPEFAERTYIEPITPEAVEKIILREKAELERMGAQGKLVLLPTLGGQTALNTAMSLHKNGALERHGVEMIGAKAEAIHKGEDREAFKQLMLQIGLDVPISGTAHDMVEARIVAAKIGRRPLIIRPDFTLGGPGGGIVARGALVLLGAAALHLLRRRWAGGRIGNVPRRRRRPAGGLRHGWPPGAGWLPRG